MAGQPRILAGFVQGTLEVIDSAGDDVARQVRAALKPEVLEEIENAWSAAWLPLSHDVAVTLAFARIVGVERACEVMRANMRETFHKPILRSMIDGAIRLLGASPGKLLRWAPRIWPLLMRDAGTLHVEPGEGRAIVRLEGTPPEMESREYLMGTGAAICAVFDLAGVHGDFRLVEHGGGRARFEILWDEA